ncbi:MAG: hypothetical protein K6F27_09660 [Ruminococcus sp.]|nr:hypothetical protein [Ruminococcus sp.]
MGTQISIKVRNDDMFYYGQKLYCIETEGHSERFESLNCPVCDNTKKVTIRGYECICPYCSYPHKVDDNTAITLRNYVVAEYIINQIKIEGPTVKKAYEKEVTEDNLPEVYFQAFKPSRSFITNRKISKSDFTSTSFSAIKYDGFPEWYFDKKEAVKNCRELHSRQKDMLKEFNKKHGYSYKYPFDSKGG